MKPLTVIVTASGAPGTAALLHALRANGEREVRLVGTDMSERSVGRHLCDAFHLVPAGSDPGFPRRDPRDRRARGRSGRSCRSRRSTSKASPARPVASATSPSSSLRPTRSTARTTRPRATPSCAASGLPAPDFRRVQGAAAGRGGRARARLSGPAGVLQAGVLLGLARLPDPRPDRRPRRPAPPRAARLGLDAPRGGGRDPGVGRRPDRPARDGARHRPGAHDRRDRERLARSSSATRRPARRCAPASRCTSSRSRTTALMTLSNAIVAELGIEHFFNIQLVGDYVIEINPRISTIVYQEDLNLPYLGVKRAIGEISDDELRALRPRIRPGPDGAALLRPARVRCRLRALSFRDTSGDCPRDMARQDMSGDCPRTRPEETCLFESRTARSTSPGSRGRTSQALRRKGVDARLVVFNRGKLHPEADWSLDRHGGLPRRLATQFAALAKLLPKTDVFHFYFGLTLVPPSLQFPILQAARKKSVFHYLGSDIRGKTPGRADRRQARRRGDRRLLRRASLGARGARRPARPRPARVHARAAVRQPAAARRPRAVEPREEGHAAT